MNILRFVKQRRQRAAARREARHWHDELHWDYRARRPDQALSSKLTRFVLRSL